jgi:hypothetical protein
MKRVLEIGFGAALIALLATSASGAGGLDLGSLPVHAERGRAAALREQLPEARTVVIVIDVGAARSARWLDELADTGFNGNGALIVQVGQIGSQQRISRQRDRLRNARWAGAPLGSTLEHLEASALPAIYGVDAAGIVQWRLPTSGRRSDEIALRISDWLNHEPRPAPGSE